MRAERGGAHSSPSRSIRRKIDADHPGARGGGDRQVRRARTHVEDASWPDSDNARTARRRQP
jgi:hypothetical protein